MKAFIIDRYEPADGGHLADVDSGVFKDSSPGYLRGDTRLFQFQMLNAVDLEVAP